MNLNNIEIIRVKTSYYFIVITDNNYNYIY